MCRPNEAGVLPRRFRAARKEGIRHDVHEGEVLVKRSHFGMLHVGLVVVARNRSRVRVIPNRH